MILSMFLAAAQPGPVTPALSDEFDGTSLSSDWTRYDQAYGWPDKAKRLEVSDGMLRLEPYSSAWVRDLQAPFLFKTLQGDFDVRARVRARGLNSAIPGGTWSLGGLMARIPNGQNASNWQPRSENWHFITTGVGFERGRPMTETKGTYNSYSSLKLRPFGSGWVELRLVKVGMALFALARADESQPWQLRDRFYRMYGSPFMQVGLIAYTHSDDVPDAPDNPERDNRTVNRTARTDMALDVDWIRFSQPRAPSSASWQTEVSGANRLTDPNLSEADVLALLGA
jgi:hypothetical protein